MHKLSLTFFLFTNLILLNSCSKKEPTPLPESLKSYTLTVSHCTCEPFIDEYRWKGEIVYLQSCHGPQCDCTTTYYDDKGQKINISLSYDQFRLESTFIKNAWTCNMEAKGF